MVKVFKCYIYGIISFSLRGKSFTDCVNRKKPLFERNGMVEMEPIEGSRNIVIYLPCARRTSQQAYNELAISRNIQMLPLCT
jgi:hypothetical protein